MPELLNTLALFSGGLAFELATLRGILGVVLGVGALIFFHEMGHFLAAKWAGVRVEVFSLGFGRRLVGFKRGDTDYRISMLPLGGYVRMLGQADEDPFQPTTDREDDFRNKSPFQRFVILAAGVAMNLVLAGLGFIAAFGLGIEFYAPEIGTVSPGSPASRAGLRVGDVVLRIDDNEILGWQDLQTLVALADGEIELEVLREGKKLKLRATPFRGEEDTFPMLGVSYTYVLAGFSDDSVLKAAGAQPNTPAQSDRLLNISPVDSRCALDLRLSDRQLDQAVDAAAGSMIAVVERTSYDEGALPISRDLVELPLEVSRKQEYTLGLTIPDRAYVRRVSPGGPADQAGIRAGDQIVTVGEFEGITLTNLRERILETGVAQGEAPVRVVVRRPEQDNQEAEVELQVSLSLENGPFLAQALKGISEPAEQEQIKREVGRWLLGVEYRSDVLGAPAELPTPEGAEPVRLAEGDRLVHIWQDGGLWWSKKMPVGSGDSLQAFLRERQEEPFRLDWIPAGKTEDDMQHAVVQARVDTGQDYADLGFGLAPRAVLIKRGPVDAVALGLHETAIQTQRIFLMLRSFLTGGVSPKELGGPIQIVDIVHKVARRDSLSRLLHLLAILSVNLAVINILPIPVLDGGHILFLFIEKLKGRPVSQDVLAYAQWLGLFVILGLMALVFFNDIRRLFTQ